MSMAITIFVDGRTDIDAIMTSHLYDWLEEGIKKYGTVNNISLETGTPVSRIYSMMRLLGIDTPSRRNQKRKPPKSA
jgi:hypothetical protein